METEISAEDERADPCPVLISAALHYRASRGELCTTKQRFQSETEIQCDTAAGRHRPQYLRFMTEHTTSAAISGTRSVSTPLTVSWLVALGHIDLCVCQLMIKPTVSSRNRRDNSYFYDNVTVSHQSCNMQKRLHVFIIFNLCYLSLKLLIYLHWKYAKLTS